MQIGLLLLGIDPILLNIRTDMLDLISLAPARSLLDLSIFNHEQLYQSDEVVPTPEEHDGEGEEDGDEEAEIDDEEEGLGDFLVGERVEEICAWTRTDVVIAHYSDHEVRSSAEDDAH